MKIKSSFRCVTKILLGSMLLIPAAYGQSPDWSHQHQVQHVLLISIDGMHAVDYLNCSKGLPGVNNGEPYCPNLAELGETGINYRDTSTSRPSDSFPGLMAIVTGGSPRTVGAFYDVAYDRSYDAPINTTGNGVAGTGPGGCMPNTPATGSTTEFDEGIDVNKLALNGGAPIGVDGGIRSIDPTKLDRDPSNNCAGVYPWDFVRTNTIFGVIHQAGGYTAWSDKHPSYSSVSGHGSNGKAVDDYYSPEINSIPVGLPKVSAQGVSCDPLPDQTTVSPSNSWTDSFQNIQCYDQLKVNAVLNWINGKTHNGSSGAPVPAIFGMNFQVVSVGEKLIEKSLKHTGGYVDSIGTPTQYLLSEIEFADKSIGDMVSELKKNGIYDQTLIIITAKHGQSPIDSARYLGIGTSSTDPITTSPATILDNAHCLPPSESPSNPTGIGPTEDDVSLVWLDSKCNTGSAVALLQSTSPTTNNVAGIGEIFSGPILTTYFNAPGQPPNGDPRTPDILTTPDIGVTYSGSTKKLAEHGGFSRDDTNVIILVSNPAFTAVTITSPVKTSQVAPTILQALGLDPNALDAVKAEGTAVLPGIPFDSNNW
ncbi:MAG TPA: alkaline phosphatase family protein [Candidatus Eremiobacteraceae bacterium]|nr:alkaline phosphatase family protein [Candidatus Eremiobacteraceae bacterium]